MANQEIQEGENLRAEGGSKGDANSTPETASGHDHDLEAAAFLRDRILRRLDDDCSPKNNGD